MVFGGTKNPLRSFFVKRSGLVIWINFTKYSCCSPVVLFVYFVVVIENYGGVAEFHNGQNGAFTVGGRRVSCTQT